MPYNPYYMPSNLPAYGNYNSNPYMNTPAQQQTPIQPTQTQQGQAQQAEQLVNSGFIVVESEDVIFKYPVAPGNCVSFKIANKPVIIEKSMSHSQFDAPHYERFKLIKEDMPENTPKEENKGVYEEIKEDITAIYEQLDRLKEGLASVRKQLKPSEPTAKLNKEEIEGV